MDLIHCLTMLRPVSLSLKTSLRGRFSGTNGLLTNGLFGAFNAGVASKPSSSDKVRKNCIVIPNPRDVLSEGVWAGLGVTKAP